MVKRKPSQTEANGVAPSRAKRLRPDELLHDEAPKARAKRLKPESDEGGRQVVRLLTILRELERARYGVSVVELQDKLEANCSERTVYRDLECLERLGFRIDRDNGKHVLVDAAKGFRSFSLNADEVLALLLTGDLLAPIADTEFALSHMALRHRLLGHLSLNQRKLIAEQRRALRGTYNSPVKLMGSTDLVATIQEACDKEHCLRIVYTAPNKPAVERIVEPHLFWMHSGRPYLVAYCRSAGEFRKFALQRIQVASDAGEDFDRRPDFDATLFVSRGFGAMHGKAHTFVIQFDRTVAHLAHERSWHATQVVTTNSDGTATLSFTAEGLPEIAAFVASFGGKLRAEAPKELVEAVLALHEAGLAVHEGGFF